MAEAEFSNYEFLQLLPRIARDLVTEQYTLAQVLQRYSINQDYFDTRITPNPFFRRVVADYTKEWQSLGSTQKRLAFAAAVYLEENLPVLADRMGDRRSELPDAVAAAKLFKELAGIAPPAPNQSSAQGERFAINISFGAHRVALEATKQIEVETKALEAPKTDAV